MLQHDVVQEKTLHVVEAETENKDQVSVQVDDTIELSPSLPSPESLSHPGSQSIESHGDEVEESEYINREDPEQSEYTDDTEDLEESEYTESEADELVSETDETVHIKEVDTSKENQTRSPKEKGAPQFEEEDVITLTKSKFRRGRIVNLESESNAPRRLRFRRGRVVGDNDDSKIHARRRNFKKRENGDEADGASPSSEKVVLRHQDVQGKKDAQGLFNNVIEETASKLVESRKSKVKALVGAFETVISLQETKPSTPSAS